VALFAALLLMSYDVRVPAVAGCAGAVATELGALAYHLRARGRFDVDAVQLGTASLLFLVLLAIALVTLSRATRHR
jgi:hypothetical protein